MTTAARRPVTHAGAMPDQSVGRRAGRRAGAAARSSQGMDAHPMNANSSAISRVRAGRDAPLEPRPPAGLYRPRAPVGRGRRALRDDLGLRTAGRGRRRCRESLGPRPSPGLRCRPRPVNQQAPPCSEQKRADRLDKTLQTRRTAAMPAGRGTLRRAGAGRPRRSTRSPRRSLERPRRSPPLAGVAGGLAPAGVVGRGLLSLCFHHLQTPLSVTKIA